ncbi:Kelch repeat-containing protein [Nocardioides terrisoli]|uniref:hypothetical protein n=1 Tax=Nocardioides terrisoli TaxID=3388267 RepID=UPI00287B7A85|nr:hypothetical protein [Nocardioides marmorisolisilvae]
MRRILAGVVLLAVAGCGGTRPAAAPPAGPTDTPSSTTSGPHGAGRFGPGSATATIVRWRLPEPVAREVIASASGTRVIVAGGMRADDTSTARSYRLDLSTGRTTSAPALAVPVHDAAGGAWAGLPGVFGGGNASEQSVVQQLRGGRWRVVAHLPTTRSDLSVAEVAGATYVLGGYDGSSVPRPVLRQRSGAGLVPAGSLRHGVRYAASAVVGRDVYLFGGEVAGRELGVVQRYDARTGRTAAVARLPHPLGHAMAASIAGRVLLMGGHTSPTGRTARMWWFDPSSGRFRHAGRLPRPLSDAAVAVAGSSVMLLGGEDPAVTDRVVRVVVHPR